MEPRVKVEGEWPLAIVLCVVAISIAGCIIGSLWALSR